MNIAKAAKNLILKEIDKTSTPVWEALEIALQKGKGLAEELNADKTIVEVGIYLMDLKVGEAWKKGKVEDHIQMSLDTSDDFLKKSKVTADFRDKVLNCIAAHHEDIAYQSIEAEICSNADSYQFLDLKGFFLILAHLIKNGLPLDKCLEIMASKIEEKYKKISLEPCKKEADRNYKILKRAVALLNNHFN